MTTDLADPLRPTCDRQREVLRAIRDRGMSVSLCSGCGSAVILKAAGRTYAIHGGLRSLTLGEVQRIASRGC